jgi:hypothetical protein
MCLQAKSEGTVISPMEAKSSPRFVQQEYTHRSRCSSHLLSHAVSFLDLP